MSIPPLQLPIAFRKLVVIKVLPAQSAGEPTHENLINTLVRGREIDIQTTIESPFAMEIAERIKLGEAIEHGVADGRDMVVVRKIRDIEVRQELFNAE